MLTECGGDARHDLLEETHRLATHGGVELGRAAIVALKIGEGVRRERRVGRAHMLGAEQAVKDGARIVGGVVGRLGRHEASEVDHVGASVGAAMCLNVAGDVQGAVGDEVWCEIELARNGGNHGVDVVVVGVNRGAIAGAVDDRAAGDGQRRHGDETKAEIVDETHERETEIVDVTLAHGNDTFQLVTGGAHRILVVGRAAAVHPLRQCR
jgi:hypothetical protein